MSMSSSNAALPLAHPPSPEQPQPRMTRYELTDDGRAVYVIYDHRQRRTVVDLPAELACEATEAHIDRWINTVAALVPERPPVTPSACRVLPFPCPPGDPGP